MAGGICLLCEVVCLEVEVADPGGAQGLVIHEINGDKQ